MPFRFRRSKRILPGVRLNVGKRGVSASVGGRGAHVTVGRMGMRQTVSAPGTGVSYTTKKGCPLLGGSVLLLLLLACGGTAVVTPTARPALPTVAPSWTPEVATATAVPTPSPTSGIAAPVRAVTLPASDCACDQDRYNCGDFGASGAEAQACYQHCMDLVGADVHHLDKDGDGDACEWDG
jgi:hypothetical protein